MINVANKNQYSVAQILKRCLDLRFHAIIKDIWFELCIALYFLHSTILVVINISCQNDRGKTTGMKQNFIYTIHIIRSS